MEDEFLSPVWWGRGLRGGGAKEVCLPAAAARLASVPPASPLSLLTLHLLLLRCLCVL